MLALVLRTLKIYILVRGSDKRAVDRWTQTMPGQWCDLVTSNSIEFVVGDMTDPMLGIGKDVLGEMKREVTLIIHAAAANISFETSIDEAIADNCLPSLRLAGMASEFEKLGCFVQVSTAYANSFLPDGPIDLVAKILFQHVLLETRGIIHASSLNYISKTMNQIMAEARHGADHCSAGWGAIMARNVFTTDRSNQECRIARSYKGMLAGDWQFDNTKSRGLGHDGPLSLDISNHDMSAFTQKRVIEIFNMRGRSGASNHSRWLRRSLCGYQLSGEICKPRNCLPLSFPQRTWHACRAASKVGSGTRAITSSTWGPCWASIS